MYVNLFNEKEKSKLCRRKKKRKLKTKWITIFLRKLAPNYIVVIPFLAIYLH